ncbi:CLUMA_CG015367, isoform A [Clunio marinus]|uniref:Ferritin n=1 Tax=Clunio marinus TaxID=568069 RepID=A0A1J1ISB0_9DIPT|nr:CLUMA_CG015367, isoform A [Clunio marinus]
MASQARQNFHEKCEEAINRQINMELFASYSYLSMAFHFDRDDVALPGLYSYFKKASDEEREHAMKFLEYLNKRGGRIILQDIKTPQYQKEMTALDAMAKALELEKEVNASLLEIHGIASSNNDANMCDFLESEFLQEQVDGIKELSDHVTNLKRVGEGLIKRCYQCRSRGDLGSCKDPFRFNASHIDTEPGVTAVPCASGWCGKVMEGETGAFREDDFDLATQRMCVQRGPDDNEDRCANTVYNHKKVFMCFCQGDLCNGSTMIHYNTLKIVLTSTIFLITLQIYFLRNR